MAIGHILYCYRPGMLADLALREACRIAACEGGKVTVAVVRETGPVARGCCGMTAGKWRELLDDVDAEDARRAGEIARSERAAARVVILGGDRTPELITDYARDQDCDVIAFPPRSLRSGGNPLPRRAVRRIRTIAPCQVLELADSRRRGSRPRMSSLRRSHLS